MSIFFIFITYILIKIIIFFSSDIPIRNIEDFKINIQSCRELIIPRKSYIYNHHVFVGEANESGCDLYHYASRNELLFNICPPGKIMKVRLNYQTYDTSSDILKIINFPEGGTVFIANRQDYPQTMAERNACIEKANSRVDEMKYSASFNNCESYVNWIFANDNTSNQSKESWLKYFSTLVVDELIFPPHKLIVVLKKMNVWVKHLLKNLNKSFELNLEQNWDNLIRRITSFLVDDIMDKLLKR